MVPEGDSAGPAPAPFAETMVEYQDAGGVWRDITCDTRTVDIAAGRQEILEQFQAATLTLTMAHFDDIYSGWPPDSVWASATTTRYRTDVPVRVNMFTEALVTGVIELGSGAGDEILDGPRDHDLAGLCRIHHASRDVNCNPQHIALRPLNLACV